MTGVGQFAAIPTVFGFTPGTLGLIGGGIGAGVAAGGGGGGGGGGGVASPTTPN